MSLLHRLHQAFDVFAGGYETTHNLHNVMHPPGLVPPAPGGLSTAVPILSAVVNGLAFGGHSAQGAQAAHRGDAEGMEDGIGESLLDLASSIPFLGGGVALVRGAHDAISTSLGGPTLGQRAGRGGPRSDFTDIEARDRLERGDTAPHAIAGGDSDRRARNAANESRVQAQLQRLQAERAAQQQAQAAEHARQHPNGDPANGTDPIAAAQAHAAAQQRAATAGAPAPRMPQFTSITDPNADPVAARYRPAEIRLDLD